MFFCQGFDFDQIMSDMRKMKIIIKGHERRIKGLEEKLAEYEAEENGEEDWMEQCTSLCLSSARFFSPVINPTHSERCWPLDQHEYSSWFERLQESRM